MLTKHYKTLFYVPGSSSRTAVFLVLVYLKDKINIKHTITVRLLYDILTIIKLLISGEISIYYMVVVLPHLTPWRHAPTAMEMSFDAWPYARYLWCDLFCVYLLGVLPLYMIVTRSVKTRPFFKFPDFYVQVHLAKFQLRISKSQLFLLLLFIPQTKRSQ